MKKSESENSLDEENFVTKSQKLTTKNKIKRQTILTTKLRKSFSEDIAFIENDNNNLNDNLLTSTPQLLTSSQAAIGKIKTRSRLSAAFRSFRRPKAALSKKSIVEVQSNKDSTTAVAVSEQQIKSITDEEADTQKSTLESTPILKKKKSKLSKKFSLSGIKKYKSSPRKTKNQLEPPTFVSSSTQTPSNLERHTAEGNNLNNSQLNLIETTATAGTENEKLPSASEVKLDKVRKIQITLSGKKVEKTRKQRKNLPITTTSFTEDEDYLTALPAESSANSNNTNDSNLGDKNQEITDTSGVEERRDERGKVNVTQSIRDTPPQERAPAKPSPNPKISFDQLSQSSRDISPTIHTIDTTTTSTTTTTTSPTLSDISSSKGAIKKSVSYHTKLKRQQSREEYFDSDRLMRREGNLDRGRRFPRRTINTIDHSSLPESQQQSSLQQHQQQQQQQQEESLQSLNPTIEQQQQHHHQQQQQQQQHINKEVENIQSGNNITNPNLSGSIVNTTNQSLEESEVQHPLSVRESKIQFSVGKAVRPHISLLNQITSDSKDFSSIGSNKSSDSQSPVNSEGSSARRKIKYIDQATFYTDEEREILAGKREIYSNLSNISEYSFDSEFSLETQMPAFGDLTMDHEEAVSIPIMTTLSSEKREHLYKILVIGELGTGKTSFIKRYVHQFFSQNYRATIGVDFALKVLHWDKNTIVRLQLWDIAGQERFGNMTRVYYKEAVGAFIVFDVTRSGTFDCVSKWKEDLDSKVQLPDGSPIPCILLANKCDQEKQCAITSEKMEEYCRENGFAGWFETSAKDNINIEEAATALVKKILLNDKLISASDITDNDKFALGGGSGTSTSQAKKTCSC